MAELIDREALLWEYKTNNKYTANAASLAQCIHDTPTVDAVEVVRCKDCINYNTDNCCDGFGWCENLGIGVHDYFFCKIGERKDNG